MTNIIRTDRTRVSVYEDCPRKRYWLYEFGSKGLEKADDLKLDARIGTWVHGGIERWFIGTDYKTVVDGASYCSQVAGAQFLADCLSTIDFDAASDQLKHDIYEGKQIVEALVYAWLLLKAPRLMADGEVLAIEKELTVDFPVGTDTVRLMARPDIIWRRHADGTIFIRNLKTVRNADDKWREKWALDMQTLSEPLAVDEWLRQQALTSLQSIEAGEPDGYNPEQCGGVIIDGLVTGRITSAKSQFGGLYHHNNPLIYAFRREQPDGTYVYQPEYKYGLQKIAVADCYPGGIIAWVDYLLVNSPEIVEEHIIELPPIIRSDYQIERWKRQVLPREVEIHRWAKMIDDGPIPDYHLDAHFPMHTGEGNCLYPGKCPVYGCCWGSDAADPLNSGYKLRVPNHPIEGDTK